MRPYWNRERKRGLKAISVTRTGQKGQAVIMITLGITVLIGLLGLVVDVGYAYFVKQAAQGAADSAAMAAIAGANGNRGVCGTTVLCQTAYLCPSSPTNSNNFGVGCLYAKSNGFVNAGNQRVSISSGTGAPPSASGITTKYWVTATTTQELALGFLSAMGVHGGWVWAQATAAVFVTPSPGCVYVLDPTDAPSLKVNGGAGLQSNCGVYVNSSAANALSVANNATLTASAVNVVGGVNFNGSNITPAPVTGTTAVADPLASLPAPTFSGCDYSSPTISGGTVTLNPGVYCGGLSISGQANVTFNPGMYILNGGGLSSTSSNTVLSGSGVSFYNTSSPGYNFSPISISGGTTLSLTAPTSGAYQGILIFQDRAISSGSASSITGSSDSNLSGTVYMPTADLSFSGSSASSLTLALVVRSLAITGSSQLNKDTTGAVTAVKTTASLVQ